MSPIRCADCEKNVSLEIGEVEVQETRLGDSGNRIEVDLHMMLTCAECGSDLGEFTGTSDHIVPKLEEYVEKHDLDVSDSEVDEAEVSNTKIITRGGRKTYIAEWTTQLTLNEKVFKVNGELAINQDQIELLN